MEDKWWRWVIIDKPIVEESAIKESQQAESGQEINTILKQLKIERSDLPDFTKELLERAEQQGYTIRITNHDAAAGMIGLFNKKGTKVNEESIGGFNPLNDDELKDLLFEVLGTTEEKKEKMAKDIKDIFQNSSNHLLFKKDDEVFFKLAEFAFEKKWTIENIKKKFHDLNTDMENPEWTPQTANPPFNDPNIFDYTALKTRHQEITKKENERKEREANSTDVTIENGTISVRNEFLSAIKKATENGYTLQSVNHGINIIINEVVVADIHTDVGIDDYDQKLANKLEELMKNTDKIKRATELIKIVFNEDITEDERTKPKYLEQLKELYNLKKFSNLSLANKTLLLNKIVWFIVETNGDVNLVSQFAEELEKEIDIFFYEWDTLMRYYDQANNSKKAKEYAQKIIKIEDSLFNYDTILDKEKAKEEDEKIKKYAQEIIKKK